MYIPAEGGGEDTEVVRPGGDAGRRRVHEHQVRLRPLIRRRRCGSHGERDAEEHDNGGRRRRLLHGMQKSKVDGSIGKKEI